METSKLKFILPLLMLAAASGTAPLHALTYVTSLEEPGVYTHRYVKPGGQLMRSGISYVRYLHEPGYRPLPGHGDPSRVWLIEGRYYGGYVGKLPPKTLPWIQQRGRRAPVPQASAAGVKSAASHVSSFSKPVKQSTVPAGYELRGGGHWVKIGTNHLTDPKWNHHSRCPGCGH